MYVICVKAFNWYTIFACANPPHCLQIYNELLLRLLPLTTDDSYSYSVCTYPW